MGLVRKQSHSWWFEGHNSPRRSAWLQSALAELDEKTKAMLKLIEEDADSFAQRAEMYYKKRPQLINMVEDFYRTHRSLAERFDLVKQDSAPRVLTTFGSPFSSCKLKPVKFANMMVDRSYDSYSDTYDIDDSGDSEVDDPDHDSEIQNEGDDIISNTEAASFNEAPIKLKNEVLSEELKKIKEANENMKQEKAIQKDNPDPDSETQIKEEDDDDKVSSTKAASLHEESIKPKNEATREELEKLREKIENLKGENEIQKDQLMQKDEEKREVIRQLSLALEMLKDENVKLRRKEFVKVCPTTQSPFEFNKLKGMFFRKFFGNGSSRNSEISVVAL